MIELRTVKRGLSRKVTILLCENRNITFLNLISKSKLRSDEAQIYMTCAGTASCHPDDVWSKSDKV